jgi:putative membrane protein
MMVNDHKKDIAAFKKESTDGTDANVKAFATKTLPTLENHLKESDKVKSALK